MRNTILSVALLALVAVFAGCESDPHVYNPNARFNKEAQMAPGGGVPIVGGEGIDGWQNTTDTGLNSLLGEGQGTPVDHPFKSSPVYFAYDSAVVGSAYDNLLKAVADYINANPNYYLTIEGHCDERGSDEYNRALSERRALAVKEALVGYGAPDARINTVGYGEEKPAVQGTDLEAYAKNRRAEFAVFSK
jgi:peptidoglycan-associated lipoprotein